MLDYPFPSFKTTEVSLCSRLQKSLYPDLELPFGIYSPQVKIYILEFNIQCARFNKLEKKQFES